MSWYWNPALPGISTPRPLSLTRTRPAPFIPTTIRRIMIRPVVRRVTAHAAAHCDKIFSSRHAFRGGQEGAIGRCPTPETENRTPPCGQANGCQENEYERGDCRNFTIAGRRGQSLCHRSRRSDLCHRAPIRRFETGPFGRFGGMARSAVVDQIAHRRAAIWRPYPLSRQRRDPE